MAFDRQRLLFLSSDLALEECAEVGQTQFSSVDGGFCVPTQALRPFIHPRRWYNTEPAWPTFVRIPKTMSLLFCIQKTWANTNFYMQAVCQAGFEVSVNLLPSAGGGGSPKCSHEPRLLKFVVLWLQDGEMFPNRLLQNSIMLFGRLAARQFVEISQHICSIFFTYVRPSTPKTFQRFSKTSLNGLWIDFLFYEM